MLSHVLHDVEMRPCSSRRVLPSIRQVSGMPAINSFVIYKIEIMEIEHFLPIAPSWANEPCLYIVKCDAADAFRCGASGTKVYKGADLSYNSKGGSLKSRLNMYMGYWLPLKGRVYAALRIQKKLVAHSGARTGTDSEGNTFAVDKQRTLVLEREAEFHRKLDAMNRRWKDDRKNELFKGPVQDLIDVLRTIDGEEFITFNKDTWNRDDTYKSKRTLPSDLKEVSTRKLPARSSTTRVAMSRSDIEKLRANDPATIKKAVQLAKVPRALKQLQLSYGTQVAKKSLVPGFKK